MATEATQNTRIQKGKKNGRRMKSAEKSSHTIYSLTLHVIVSFPTLIRYRRTFACVYAYVCMHTYRSSVLTFIQLFIKYIAWTSVSTSSFFDSCTQISDARARSYGMWCHSWKSCIHFIYVCVCVWLYLYLWHIQH